MESAPRRTPRLSALSLVVLATVASVLSVASADPPKPQTFVGHGMGAVAFLRFSPKGGELIRICQFGPVELFDTADYERIRTFPTGMRMISFNPEGTRIATAEGTDGARVWDAALPGQRLPKTAEIFVREAYLLETPLRVLELPSSTGASSLETRADKRRVFRAEFSPDGKRLVTTYANGHAKVWSGDAWSLESDLPLGDSELISAAFTPDGKAVVIGDADGVLHEWTFERKADVKTATGRGAISEIVFAPDGNLLATVHESKTGSAVVFWDKARKVVEAKEDWSSVAFSKDGKSLAIGGSRVEFLDPSSRKTVRTVKLPTITLRESHPMFAKEANADTEIPVSVVALAFSPNGATLAAGCQDGSIRLLPTAP